jgi:hypothetical protein
LDGHLGGSVDRDAGMPILDEPREAPVLDYDRVGRKAAEKGEQSRRLRQFVLENHGIQGGVEFDALVAGEAIEPSVLDPIEIFGLLACGKIGKTEIKRIRASLDSRDGGIETPGGKEKLGQSI